MKEGKKEGRKEGKKEGRNEGRKERRKEERKEGRKKGRKEGVILPQFKPKVVSYLYLCSKHTTGVKFRGRRSLLSLETAI